MSKKIAIAIFFIVVRMILEWGYQNVWLVCNTHKIGVFLLDYLLYIEKKSKYPENN